MLFPFLSGRLTILIYHRVHEREDPLFPEEVDAPRFDAQLRWLKSEFDVLPLGEAVTQLAGGKLRRPTAAITFDDGYADNLSVALPILARHRLPAAFFISSGFLGGGRMWNDTIIEAVRRCADPMLDLSSLGLGVHPIETPERKRAAIEQILGLTKYLSSEQRPARVAEIARVVRAGLPTDLMLEPEGVRALHRAGMEIGGHTVHHPILARQDADSAQREIEEGKRALESLIGSRVRLFAYPNGRPGQDYLAEHVGMVKQAGFEAAVSTAWGCASADSDRYQLPRFTPWDRSSIRFKARLAQNRFRQPVLV